MNYSYLALQLVSYSLGVCVGVEYGVKSLPLQQGQCPSLQERERVWAQISAEVEAILSGAVYSCNGSPGWRRVGFVNMTDPSQDCPPGLDITSHLIRTCGSSHHSLHNCSSTIFSVGGSFGIELSYVDGVSLTHGGAGERQHIWTFAAGGGFVFCPCDIDQALPSPPFVGEDYFCETGNTTTTDPTLAFFGSNPLWDGEGCGSNSTCCQFNNPPWFTKTLPAPTTDDIELKLCHFQPMITADIPIELIELYIK